MEKHENELCIHDEENSGKVIKNKSARKVFIKILKIIGLIFSAVILFFNCLWMYDTVSGIEELNYPATAIMPIILFSSVITGSILLAFSIIKNKKKIMIISAVILIVRSIISPITKAVNRTIIQATDGGAMLEAETDNKDSEEKEYVFYTIADLKKMYNSDAYTDIIESHILGIVKEVDVIKIGDSYFYSATITDTENNELKIQIASSEKNLIYKNKMYEFYGNVFTDNKSVSEFSMLVDTVKETD